MDLQEAFDAGFVAVKAYVDHELGAFEARMAALEARQPERGERGLDGQNGKDGSDGIDGKDGASGADGKDAEPIAPEQIEAVVRAWLEANPPTPGQDGIDGKDGRDGVDGTKGEPGADGRDGADGIGLSSAVIDRDHNLIITLADGSTRSLGVVVGRDGIDGKDGRDGSDGRHGEKGEPGRDGFSLTDLDVKLAEDGRTILYTLTSGDLVVTSELALPAMIYRGVFKEGQTYELGDMVTWAGSLWHCSTDTADKPGEGSAAWTLAAKRGRDGKDGKS